MGETRMRHLVVAALLALAGCGPSVTAQSAAGITIDWSYPSQKVEDMAQAHCGQTGRVARLAGTVSGLLRYECMRP
jgi:ABC-type sugar transport system substrate-binding protein